MTTSDRSPIVIVDPAIVNMRGHTRRLASLLSAFFVSQGLEVIVLTHSKYAGPDFENCRTERVFDHSPYNEKEWDKAPYDFETKLSNWTSFNNFSNAIFLYPTITPRLAQAISAWIGASPLRSVHLLTIMLDAGVAGPEEQPVIVDEDAVDRYRASFAGIARGANQQVIITAPSRTLASYVRFVCELPVTEIAPPMSIGGVIDQNHLERERTQREYRLGLYLGAASPDKGFNQLASVVGLIGEETGPEWSDVRVYVQAYGASGYADRIQDVISAAEHARFAHRFTLLRSRLPDNKYEAFFRSLDGAVLSYNPNKYAGKTSGVFWELKSIGVPLAVPDNTWMSREASLLPGGSVRIAYFGAEATCGAARRLVMDRPPLVKEGLPSYGAAEMGRQILAKIADLD